MTDRGAVFVGYAHRPFDTRSACVAFVHSEAAPAADVLLWRDLGAALFFTGNNTGWNAWAQTTGKEPRHLRSLRPAEVENYFARHKDEFAPHAVFRAKTWQRAGIGRQLDFVDVGLLPMLERETGRRLLDLFERMVAVTMNELGWDSVPDDAKDAHWLTQTNFWLLAAKLLHDKEVDRFTRLDLHDVPTVFERVAVHYNRTAPRPPRANGRLRALQLAAREANAAPSFRSISAETLGTLYEGALISPTTRKLLGTHRTPTYLVDYMLAKLSGWIEEIGYRKCRVFEPACGHAPFLSGALRLLCNMLPAGIAADRNHRHSFLRERLCGCDSDPFALEIARLSLTLADIPNENGWVLDRSDMFADGVLDEKTRAATVVLANPPFEQEKAAMFFQQTVAALQPGTVFGFVLPVNELTGTASAETRRRLLTECEIKEISVFPDRMFKFASVETGIVLGRRLESRHAVVTGGIEFRRVRESKMEAFRDRYDVSWGDRVDAAWLSTENGGRLTVPELRAVWDACAKLPRFKQFTKIGQGLTHRSKEDPKFPKGAETECRARKPGLVEGFASIDDAPDTHLAPTTWWLNLDKRTIRRELAGTKIGTPQVAMNYAPVDRDAWRIKAFIDDEGRPATSRLLVLRPTQRSDSLFLLWALCNSPVANAYTFAFGSKRDIIAGLMRALPVPDLSTADTSRVEATVREYFAAARDLTRKKPAARATAKTDGRRFCIEQRTPPAADQLHLGLEGVTDERADHLERERLRALHWRVDAEVLRLYALPPPLERELLDAFDGVRRAGVPFEQTRYIPRDFRDVLTLDEFLRITDEWEATDSRRCALIEKRIKAGRRTPEEEREFRVLQRLLSLHRRYFAPGPMIDEKTLRELVEDGK